MMKTYKLKDGEVTIRENGHNTIIGESGHRLWYAAGELARQYFPEDTINSKQAFLIEMLEHVSNQ